MLVFAFSSLLSWAKPTSVFGEHSFGFRGSKNSFETKAGKCTTLYRGFSKVGVIIFISKH